MSHRRRLPDRRNTLTLSFAHSNGVSTHDYVASISQFWNGDVGELFLNAGGKVGTELDVTVCDAAVAVSLALQYGCPVNVLRDAMKRNNDGSAMGPLAHALDLCPNEFRK